MKTATIPSLRVDPALRQSAESVLREGESLSGFVEQAIRQSIFHRQSEQEFIARGLAARNQARLDNRYTDAATVIQRLEKILNCARTASGSRR